MSVFRLPDLGEGLHDAEIVEWLVKPGDTVEAGQILASVETDKAVVEIPSPRAAKIARTHGGPGDHIEVGAPLVEFDDGARTDSGALVGRLPTEGAAPRAAAPLHDQPRPPRVKATPAVRARARSLGIDLATVTATGPDGQVTADDLDRASQPSGGGKAEILRGPRRTMARNMALAHAEVATATVTDEAVVPHWTAATDVTILLARAVAAAAKAEPALNAWFDGHAMNRQLHDHVHVGIAMDTPDGLFVPVLRDADSRDAAALRKELERLKAGVMARTIAPDDLRGATVTVSNFGAIGGRHAALILMPPQVAILGAGRVAGRVVAIGGKPAVRPTVPLSLTFDHRAVTGGEAARFLAAIIDMLENSEN
jgi:pyruvate dehydrogenase E2 component (dihydrolipoamide acetyltransferase)